MCADWVCVFLNILPPVQGWKRKFRLSLHSVAASNSPSLSQTCKVALAWGSKKANNCLPTIIYAGNNAQLSRLFPVVVTTMFFRLTPRKVRWLWHATCHKVQFHILPIGKHISVNRLPVNKCWKFSETNNRVGWSIIDWYYQDSIHHYYYCH